ncbi:hypothetical protein HGRIS_012090 [Hohenbuehelia grisea]|uniref:Ribosomal protein L14 n=1 Tax=Hohenbuehelia grisea TaxID=104357 RepID=A0ABR3IR91_9AGAR
MIGLKSTLNVIDNSGALLVECVNILKQKVNNGWGGVGDEIVCVVKRARPIAAATQASVTAVKVRRGDVRRAVIVRTRKSVQRPDGRIIRFDDNAAVLLNNKREMLGTRIGGIVSADLRMKGWGKIVSLAPKASIASDPRQGNTAYIFCRWSKIFMFLLHLYTWKRVMGLGCRDPPFIWFGIEISATFGSERQKHSVMRRSKRLFGIVRLEDTTKCLRPNPFCIASSA